MKFNIGSKTLQQNLSAVFRVINAKSPLTILENFLFSLSGNVLTVRGSDQENVMTATMDVAEAEGDGMVAVPARRVLDILKELPDQGLNFDIDDATLAINISFGQGNFKFMGVAGSEYPKGRGRQEDAVTYEMPASAMLAGLENTLYAASVETIRPIMTGVCVDFKQDSLVFVASDTHKLVKYEDMVVKPGFEQRIILAPKASQLLRAMLDKEDGNLTIVMDDRGASFGWGNYELQCVFITGNYPPYDRVIPKENPFTMEADRSLLLSAVRRMVLSANSGSKLVRLQLTPDKLELIARDIDYARSGHESLACTYEGNPMSLGFNGEYMVDVLSNIHTDNICLHLADPSRPGVFTPAEQKEDTNLLVLLMTMQLID